MPTNQERITSTTAKLRAKRQALNKIKASHEVVRQQIAVLEAQLAQYQLLEKYENQS